jgi:hypothetical protein
MAMSDQLKIDDDIINMGNNSIILDDYGQPSKEALYKNNLNAEDVSNLSKKFPVPRKENKNMNNLVDDEELNKMLEELQR